MKSPLSIPFHFLVLLGLWCGSARTHAQGTAFNYQGRLVENGVAASGNYDFIFTVYGSAAGGNALATEVAANAIAVSAGQFAVPLDFGAGVFTGAARWLQISARRSGGGAHTLLSPRQALSPTPHAIYAGTAGSVANGSVTASSLSEGAVTATKLAPAAVGLAHLSAPGAPVAGQVLGFDGANLSWITAGGGGGGGGPWRLSGATAFYSAGNVGIGTTTPAHRLGLSGGPAWTAHGWVGAVELPNGSALGWQANAAGQRFGMGHANTGFYLFRTASNPGTTGSPALYDFVVNDEGNVGIGVNAPTAGYKLEVNGATLLRPANGTIQIGSPNAELGLSITPIAGSRADLRFDGTVLKLVASTGVVPPSPANGIAITTAGNVGIGSVTPQSKLEVVSGATTAIVGRSTVGGAGVYGESAQFNGVRGVAHNASHGAVVGVHDGGGAAVYGIGATGVQGDSSSAGGVGVYGRSAAGPAVHAEGHATQARDKGGFAKAMAYIDPFLPADQYVVRCYNSQKTGNQVSTAPCGIQVFRTAKGFYVIDFGFNVEDRFISLTTRGSHVGENGLVVGTVFNVTGDRVSVAFSQIGDHGTTQDVRFYIIVY